MAVVALVALVVGLWSITGGAQQAHAVAVEAENETNTDETGDDADAEADAARLAAEEQLREGSQAYSQICASCHQAGGIGISGRYPPLKDNPNVDDAAYIRQVIEEGRTGEIEVAGVLYDGIMPSFSTIPDEDVDAIVAYIQNDFVAPPAPLASLPTGPVAGTELPALTNMGSLLAFLIAAGGGVLVLGPRITSENSRLRTPWLDAWLKTAVIVASAILLTVVVPDWVIRLEPVTKLSRPAQDLIGVALWLSGLFVLLWGLWFAHRESRV